MYDDDEITDEYLEIEEQPIYEVIEDDDDDDEFDENAFEEAADDPYIAKGKEDRALVDQQAKEYDETKRNMRAELAKLRERLQILKGDIAKKERRLRDLNIELEKEDYREMKEDIVRARKEAQIVADGGEVKDSVENTPALDGVGIEFVGTDMEEEVLSPAMQKRIEREAKRKERLELEEEIKKLRLAANEKERVVSQLEHRLLRS